MEGQGFAGGADAGRPLLDWKMDAGLWRAPVGRSLCLWIGRSRRDEGQRLAVLSRNQDFGRRGWKAPVLAATDEDARRPAEIAVARRMRGRGRSTEALWELLRSGR